MVTGSAGVAVAVAVDGPGEGSTLTPIAVTASFPATTLVMCETSARPGSCQRAPTPMLTIEQVPTTLSLFLARSSTPRVPLAASRGRTAQGSDGERVVDEAARLRPPVLGIVTFRRHGSVIHVLEMVVP
jgi:hypothetical protein